MAKRETKETYNNTKSQASETKGDYAAAGSDSENRANEIESGLGGQRDAISGGYNDLMNNVQKLDVPTLSAPRSINTSELKDTLGGYRAFRDTGGLSADNVNRMRGSGGYDEFATTGGYTPESIANIKAQALSPISSYATGTRDELARRAAVQGGYTPGFDAASRQLQRDTSRAIADTSLNANVGIQDRINAGRQWGIGGIANSENSLAGLQTGNRLNALGGEAGIGNSLSNFDARDIENMTDAEKFNIMNTINSGMFNITNSQNMRTAGLGGLSNLYGSDVNRLDSELNRGTGLLDADTRARLGYLGNQTGLATQPGIGGQIVSGIGSAAGIAAGLYGGNALNGGYKFGTQVQNTGRI